MLRKNHRLSRSQFDVVFERGATSHSTYFIKKSIPTPSWSTYALSVVVPKKVISSAAARNQMKRRLYAYMRELLPSLSTPEQIILIAKKNSTSLSKKELKQELEHIFGL